VPDLGVVGRSRLRRRRCALSFFSPESPPCEELAMSNIREIVEEKGMVVHAIGQGATLFEAAESMCAYRVGALMVLEQSSPVGIISERDVLSRVILKRLDPATTPVAEVMTRGVVCIDLASSVREAMAIMTERRFRHLPVVSEGRVVAMVSIGDLVRAASKDQQFEIRMLHEYLSGTYPG
jgi:signal-transduction protein with cAMP-binding, CBS, and nucleotidyltransferase domain